MGYPAAAFVLAALVVGQAAYLGSEYWLVSWSAASPQRQTDLFWLWGYAVRCPSFCEWPAFIKSGVRQMALLGCWAGRCGLLWCTAGGPAPECFFETVGR